MLGNQTQIAEFILLGFGDIDNLQIFLFLTFLMIYLVTITGNILILVLVTFDKHFHTPMYFFLGTLSFLESCYSTNLLPRMLSDLWTGDRRISFSSCFTQWYLCASFLVTECCLLCAMSYDRYLAICKPLHYPTMMNTQTFIQLAAASWINGFTVFLVILIMMLIRLDFCGPNQIDHYFCDYFPLLKLSCNDTSLFPIMSFTVAALFSFFPFLLTLTSYVYIVAAILKIPSSTGRQKAFSTCSSHLLVVSIFYGTLIVVYMLPHSEAVRDMQKFFSLLYTTLPPLANPFIYSLRNKEVKNALKHNICQLIPREIPDPRPKLISALYGNTT
ncbi:olfactory receptor 2AP1-like [Hemicordylus capensis]|uniref:olfactory receptor 2AP1-like n=1 Tax=Hemicordylus capensis TaxID=884348 RepID=UPI00230309F7|nr:olfactory receptor 2AP1-like [Hemicordylus capensis]